jgi:hypothetical protein
MAEWLLSIERCLIPYELLAHHSNVANLVVCSGDESCFDLSMWVVVTVSAKPRACATANSRRRRILIRLLLGDLICGNLQGIPATRNAIRLHLFYRGKIKSQNTSYILETRQSQAKTVVKVEEMF